MSVHIWNNVSILKQDSLLKILHDTRLMLIDEDKFHYCQPAPLTISAVIIFQLMLMVVVSQCCGHYSEVLLVCIVQYTIDKWLEELT